MTRQEALQALTAFGCEEVLVALAGAVAADLPLVVKVTQGSNEFVPVAAGLDCEAAWYAERHRFYVALDPDRGQHFHSLTKCAVAEKNGRTWRLTLPAATAQDSRQQGHWVAALEESLRRSAVGPPPPGVHPRSVGVCPVCFQVLPATGACDDHGRPS